MHAMSVTLLLVVLLCSSMTITTTAILTPEPHHYTIRTTDRSIKLYALINNTEDAATEFQQFMVLYNKSYPTPQVQAYRFTVFQYNLNEIATANAQHTANIDPALPSNATDTTVYGINQFSDLLPIEFTALYQTYRLADKALRQPLNPPTEPPTHTPIPVLNYTTDLNSTTDEPDVADNSTAVAVRRRLMQFTSDSLSDSVKLPSAVNWQSMGATTPIGSQGQCGSCWAFSSVEQLESQYFLSTGVLPSLSKQQVTSCDPNNGGCGGGDPTAAYSYINSAGVMPAQWNQYTNGNSATTKKCAYTSSKATYKLTGWRWASPPCTQQDPSCQNVNEQLLASQIAAYGPASICVTAQNWQYYTGGILNDATCSTRLYSMDHCVQLVGFGTSSAGQKYWIIRNQWDTWWGQDGYMYLAMGGNLCGIANEASFVSVAT